MSAPPIRPPTPSPAPSPAHDAAGRRELLARAERAPHAQRMFAGVSAGLRRMVPFDAAVWRVTDPDTGIMTAPVHAEEIDEGGCAAYWEVELFSETVNLYSDLAGARVPVAALRHSTGGRPEGSAVYRDFMAPRGLDDELRVVLRTTGGRRHGTVSLFRADGRPPFDARDTALLASLVQPLARRLRSFSEPRPGDGAAGAEVGVPDGPGVLLFDPAGALVSVNEEARRLLERLPDGPSAPGVPGVRLPAWVQGLTTRVRASAARGGPGTARIRLRTRDGRWLVCHATCLQPAADGTAPGTAVVLEPARGADVVPLIADAYELSERELEVTTWVARGLSTEGIARRLYLSPHTVRDHIKAVFDKTGTSSRGELVGLLFVDHYRPRIG